jgi:hypothetical protein
MRIRLLLLAALITVSSATFVAQTSKGEAESREIALSLANAETEKAGIAAINAQGHAKIPLLLSWTRKPPSYVAECRLFDGLADAFGEIKVVEAIPYLISNLPAYRSCGVSLAPWLKEPAVIEWSLPAAGALIRMGPEASRAVMAAFPAMTGEEQRRAALFVVSRVADVPEARPFLVSVAEGAKREHDWAEEATKRLDVSKPAGGHN